MTKRIVVGIDPSKHSEHALAIACERAKAYDGTVIGIGVVDVPGIERASSGAGLGASHYAKKAREGHIKEATQRVEALVQSFVATCEAEGVAHEAFIQSGDPAEELGEFGKSADLIVIGTRTFFHFETERGAGDTLEELLREKACPVLAVPENAQLPFARVLLPYDGSAKAARAIREFIYLTDEHPLAVPVILLRIDDDVDDGLRDLERPTEFLEAHGHQVTPKVLPGTPRDLILEVAKEEPGTMVVLGASGKGALRARLFGSVTQNVIEDGTVALFVAS